MLFYMVITISNSLLSYVFFQPSFIYKLFDLNLNILFREIIVKSQNYTKNQRKYQKLINVISESKSPQENATLYCQVQSYGFLLKKVKGRVRNILHRNQGSYLSRRLKSPQPKKWSSAKNNFTNVKEKDLTIPLVKMLRIQSSQKATVY